MFIKLAIEFIHGDILRKLIAVLSVLLFLMLGCTQTPPADNHTACTADAKLCPDGSAVGRTGPNCEFAPCPVIVGNDSDEHGCKASAGYSWCELRNECIRSWEIPCRLSLEEALSLAWGSECSQAGKVTGVNAQFNNNSKTWWLDIEANKSGCNPACVVYENRSMEINWRCTGLIIYDLQTSNTSLGEILVDGYGYTLYTFASDSLNTSTCSGTCASNWPPLILSSKEMDVPMPLLHRIGIFARNSTAIQLTFDGMPLYYYAGDTDPGDMNGEGLSGKWNVVTVNDSN